MSQPSETEIKSFLAAHDSSTVKHGSVGSVFSSLFDIIKNLLSNGASWAAIMTLINDFAAMAKAGHYDIAKLLADLFAIIPSGSATPSIGTA